MPDIPSAELLASIPKRTEFTPELPDTTSKRVRAELPSETQRDLINVPLDQRRGGVTLYQRGGHSKPLPRNPLIPSPLKWSSGPPKADPGTKGSSLAPDTLMARSTARQLVTDEGVVMGANLDRYSGDPRADDTDISIEGWNGADNAVGNGKANGNSNGLSDGDPDTKKGKENSWQSQDHVMSFMNFDGNLPLTDLSGPENLQGESGSEKALSPPISPPASTTISGPISPPTSLSASPAFLGNKRGMSFLDGPLSPTTSEVPPAYEAGEGDTEFEVNGERKTPAGTMGLGVTRFG
ncbi:hypothetical protein N7454_004620 [Penicillium verhagenii]|nr:hypothetical protein N7454_004620 [Penicillium verhagenii]